MRTGDTSMMACGPLQVGTDVQQPERATAARTTRVILTAFMIYLTGQGAAQGVAQEGAQTVPQTLAGE
ncbi:hypothetical protein CVU37_03895 [candidate division BRC1 bacterium HGW-BRC1-1]|nr:MAG: hypothetical protein CVU37_03895 [candidate division BRC1 bacterium HGW-BRC1-1]